MRVEILGAFLLASFLVVLGTVGCSDSSGARMRARQQEIAKDMPMDDDDDGEEVDAVDLKDADGDQRNIPTLEDEDETELIVEPDAPDADADGGEDLGDGVEDDEKDDEADDGAADEENEDDETDDGEDADVL